MPKNKTSTIETILSKFDEKFMMPEWEDFPEMKAFLLQALKTVQEETREEMLEMCNCLKCKAYKSTVLDSQKLFAKLKEKK